MKKKLLAALLVATMAFGLTACGGGSGKGGSSSDNETQTVGDYEEVEIDGVTYHKAKDLTTDEITLTVFHYMDEATIQYLADKFQQIYPNIKVEPSVAGTGNDYMQTLLTLVNNKQYPDVIQYTDADSALANQLLYDMTDLWNSDPETEELPDTIKDKQNGFGTFSTGHRLACPAKFFPGIMYADKNVLETLNVEIPDQQWTWSQMIDIIKKCTTEVNGTKYYGLGYYNRLDSLYGIASSQKVLGEFGYDGKTFDLTAWAEGEQEFADLKQAGYVSPLQGTQEMEDWIGDWDGWCGSTGQVALFSEAYWTFQNIWNTEGYLNNFDLDIIPYVVPAVSEEDASADHHSIATIDGGGICSGTAHPREAYELMKFLFWGRDGWLARIQLYNSGASDYQNGELIMPSEEGDETFKHHDMFCPITTNEEVWDAYIDMFCDGMDDEHVEMWRNYFTSCMHPISYGWESIAGYWTACDYFNNVQEGSVTGIHNLVDKGIGKAADYKDEATQKFNWYHAEAMVNYFGPSGYDILTDEEVEEYKQMSADNAG